MAAIDVLEDFLRPKRMNAGVPRLEAITDYMYPEKSFLTTA
jgi:hypothetical protein